MKFKIENGSALFVEGLTNENNKHESDFNVEMSKKTADTGDKRQKREKK